ALEPLFLEGLNLSRSFLMNRQAGLTMEALLARLAKQIHQYEMVYDLGLTGPAPWTRFEGVKRIYGGPRLDPWTQTTTLYVTMYAGNTQAGTGTMHVHLSDFLTRQLPSFRVTGTSADVRVAWAFGRFFRFFLGTLRQVYLPRLETLDPFGDRRR